MPDGGKPVDQNSRECGTCEGETDILDAFIYMKKRDSEHNKKGSSRIDSQNTGIRNGIPGDGLHERTGNTQSGTCEDTENRTRDPCLDHVAIKTALAQMKKTPDHSLKAYGFCSAGYRGQNTEGQATQTDDTGEKEPVLFHLIFS